MRCTIEVYHMSVLASIKMLSRISQMSQRLIHKMPTLISIEAVAMIQSVSLTWPSATTALLLSLTREVERMKFQNKRKMIRVQSSQELRDQVLSQKMQRRLTETTKLNRIDSTLTIIRCPNIYKTKNQTKIYMNPSGEIHSNMQDQDILKCKILITYSRVDF